MDNHVNITRRSALKAFSAGIAAAGVPAAAMAIEPARDPVAHAEYLAGELAKAMSAISPDRKFEVLFNDKRNAVFVIPAEHPSSADRSNTREA